MIVMFVSLVLLCEPLTIYTRKGSFIGFLLLYVVVSSVVR